MIEVIVSESLAKEIKQKFGKTTSLKIADLFDSLKENPSKRKLLTSIGPFLLKELKYESFRFYFIVEGNKLKLYSKGELVELLIKFVRMSDKDKQQEVIEQIKKALREIVKEK